jgi:PPOX class probable F420-dependent enzyme
MLLECVCSGQRDELTATNLARATLTETERQLLLSNSIAALTTLRIGGAPHTTPTWVDVEGDVILINTASRLKQRNIQRDPRVGLTVVSCDNPMVYLTIEGLASLKSEGAWEHADQLSFRYRGVPHPRNPDAQRCIVRITPLRIQSVGLNEKGDKG